MDTSDKIACGIGVIVLMGMAGLFTSVIQTESFIENNCVKTEFVDTSGAYMYDCTNINID